VRIAVLASGSGTNLQALIDTLHLSESEPVHIALVLSDRPSAGALRRAREAGIPREVVSAREYATRDAFDEAIGASLDAHGVQLVVLAGFMMILQPAFVRRFAGRLLNIHPALLPAFAGADGIGDAIRYGVKVTGVTVHFVDEGVDTGPVVAQVPVFVQADDTEETLAERIHAVEHRLYPAVVRAVAQGRVRLEGRRVRLDSGEIRWDVIAT